MSSDSGQKKGVSLKLMVPEFDLKQGRSSGWEHVRRYS